MNSLLKGAWSMGIGVLAIAIVGAIVFFMFKWAQWKYDVSVFQELEGNNLVLKRSKGNKKREKSGSIRWFLSKPKREIDPTKVVEFPNNKALVFIDKQGNLRDITVDIEGIIHVTGADKQFAMYEVREAVKDYQKQSAWEKFMPYVAWGSLLVMQFIFGVIMIKMIESAGH